MNDLASRAVLQLRDMAFADVAQVMEIERACFSMAWRETTFESLLRHFDLRRAPLQRIGEIVHDLDLKDDKFGRPERRAFAAAMTRVVRSEPDDADRLARAFDHLDRLYERLAGGDDRPG